MKSIGAFYATRYLFDVGFEKALFLSSLLDMKETIERMMKQYGISFEELSSKGTIPLDNGQTLSSRFYEEVSFPPFSWHPKTCIVRGEKDEVVSLASIERFVKSTSSSLFLSPDAGHYFHREKELVFLKTVAENFFH